MLNQNHTSYLDEGIGKGRTYWEDQMDGAYHPLQLKVMRPEPGTGGRSKGEGRDYDQQLPCGREVSKVIQSYGGWLVRMVVSLIQTGSDLGRDSFVIQ